MDRLIIKSQNSIKKKKHKSIPSYLFYFFKYIIIDRLKASHIFKLCYIYDKFKHSINSIRIKLGHSHSPIY